MYEKLLKQAYKMLHDWQTAEDAVQETYLQLTHRGEQTIRSNDAWLQHTCRNVCINLRKKHRPITGHELDQVANDPSETILESLDIPVVQDAMRRLPPQEQAIIQLVVVDGQTCSKAKVALGVTQKQAQRLRERALKHLKRSLNRI
jgi:RNA polymerase sigma factor (sigma-70 family)